ncbi:hypothetical protein L1887_21166 [Cichorium endivia]|nr:hypothetical protein L1887_21166 [Cichorium endivia]
MGCKYSAESIMEYEEHEKRAWTVEFSRTKLTVLVSGSDGCKVKILGYGNRFGFDPLPLLNSLDMETGLVCPFQQKN